MKKLFFLTATVALLATACQKDGNKESEPTAGVEHVSSDRLGGYQTIPVSADGAWTLEVDEERCDWIVVSGYEGRGNQSAEIFIEPNATGNMRSAVLTLTDAATGEHTHFPVYQDNTLGGEAPDNSDETLFLDAFKNKGLGAGYNLMRGKPTTSPVVNLASLSKVLATYPEYEGVYREATLSDSDQKLVRRDSIVKKDDHLKVALTVSVNFAKFNMKLSGNYDNKETVAANNNAYFLDMTVPKYEASLDLESLAALHNEILEDDTKTEKARKTLRQQIFSPGFVAQMDKVTAAYEKGEAEFKSAVDRLDQSYGPVLTDRAEMGGALGFNIMTDVSKITENFNIKGKLEGALTLAIITISADVSVDYGKAGTDILKNSNVSIHASGGNLQSVRDFASSYVTYNYKADAAENSPSAELGEKWVNSIMLDPANPQNNTAEVTHFDLRPIWLLFDDEVGAAMEEYLKEKYSTANTFIKLSEF